MRRKLLIVSLSTIMLLSGCGADKNGKVTEDKTEAASAAETVTEGAAETSADTEDSSIAEASTETASEASTEAVTEADTEEDIAPSPSYVLSSIEDVDSQLQLIADSADTWRLSAEDSSDWYYAVTDLDRNGRLEIITSMVAGTGMYTTSKYYEVNPDHTAIEPVKFEFSQGDSEPDINVEMADFFCDEESGDCYYIFNDVLRVTAADIAETLYKVSLKNGEINAEVIASSHISSLDDGETVETEYKDKKGNVISAEEYENVCLNEFPEAQHGSITIGWNTVREYDQEALFPESPEEIRGMIDFSATGFTLCFD